MNQFKIALIAVSLLIFGCGNDSSKYQTGNMYYMATMDDQVAWTESPRNNIISIEDAPSGKMVSSISSDSPYSSTFFMKNSAISAKPLSKVVYSAMVKVSGPDAEPLIVIDILDKDGKSLEWISKGIIDVEGSVNKWVKLTAELNLTENNRNLTENSLKIYVSNGKSRAALVDDIEIQFFN